MSRRRRGRASGGFPIVPILIIAVVGVAWLAVLRGFLQAPEQALTAVREVPTEPPKVAAAVPTATPVPRVAAPVAPTSTAAPRATAPPPTSPPAPATATAVPTQRAVAAQEPTATRPALAAPAKPTSSLPRATTLRWDTRNSVVEHDQELAAALEEAIGDVDGRLGLAVKDLGSGRGALLGADTELPAASLFKLNVLYSVFNAKVGLGEQLQITPRIKEYDLGTLELAVGDTLSVAEALERMVTISDNSSAILLADRVGPTRINQDMSALGLRQTHYLTDRLNTSALNMMHVLELIARGDAVSPQASAEMVHLLLRQRINDRLPSLLPENARVAHKTGNLPGVVNDVGIVYGPRSTVIVAALVAESDEPGAAAQAIARAALAAHRHFEALPAASGGPEIPPRPDRPVPPTRRGA